MNLVAAKQAYRKPILFFGGDRAVLAIMDLYNLGAVFGDPVLLAGGGR